VGQLGVAQAAQRFLLQLADALPAEAELVGDLLQRMRLAAAQAEAQAQDVALAGGQLGQHLLDRLLQQVLRGRFERAGAVLIFDEVAELAIAVVAHRALQGDGVLAGVHHAAHGFRRQLHLGGDLFRRGPAAEVLLQHLGGAVHLADALGHVQRDADGARLLGQGAGDRLADPPGGIRAEAVAALVIVLVHGAHQPDVAFLDQVGEGQALPHVALGDGNHQARIGPAQVLAGGLAIVGQEAQLAAQGRVAVAAQLLQLELGVFAALDALGQLDLFPGGQERLLSHLAEVEADRVVGGHGIDIAHAGVGHTLFGAEFVLAIRVKSCGGELLFVVLPQFDAQVIQLIQYCLDCRYVVPILTQDFQYILESDIALLIGTIHQFLDHGRFVASLRLRCGRLQRAIKPPRRPCFL